MLSLVIHWGISGRYQWKYEKFSCVVASRGHFEIEQEAEPAHMGIWHQGIHCEPILSDSLRSDCPAYFGILRHRENQWSLPTKSMSKFSHLDGNRTSKNLFVLAQMQVLPSIQLPTFVFILWLLSHRYTLFYRTCKNYETLFHGSHRSQMMWRYQRITYVYASFTLSMPLLW